MTFIKSPPIWLIAITLIFGAGCLGASTYFVRISEVGPISSAFWRSFLALPLILILIRFLRIQIQYKIENTNYFYLALPGIFLGIDHAAWHHGIMLTTIANSTLFASMAPVFVVIYSYLLFSIIINKKFLFGLIASIIGAVLLMYSSLELSIKNIYGDFWSLLAGAFYAAYLMSTGILRDRRLNIYIIFLFGTLFSALTLLIIVIFSNETILPVSLNGWLIIFCLAFISQFIGIGLITWALGKVKTGLASLTLMSEPVTASFLAWLLLGEYLTAIQLVGGIIILFGIIYAQSSSELKQ